MIRLNKTQGIVVQGPLLHHHNAIGIIQFYSQFDNVVISTWDTTDVELIEYAKSLGMSVVLSTIPETPGHLNLNCQFLSTFTGIRYFAQTNRNINEILKVRSDVAIYGVERLLNILQGYDIAFPWMYVPENPFHIPIYYLDGIKHTGMDFPSDHVLYGKLTTLSRIFDRKFNQEVPPESVILGRYLTNRYIPYTSDINRLKKLGVFFFGDKELMKTHNYYSYNFKAQYDSLDPYHLAGYTLT